jgi:hypothetical protein
MKRILAPLAVALTLATGATMAPAATLVDGTTMGLYNSGIGTVLNGTSAAFPSAGDPTQNFAVAPDLSPAAAALGDWLTNPARPGGTWSDDPVAIPRNWTVQHETAVIYEIDGGATGLSDVVASIGVDNGIFVWLNGEFIGGNMAPGGARAGEYVYDLGDLAAGTNYLQLLREDHGGGTGFSISVTGETAAVPLPASALLLLAGLGGLGALRRRAG